MPANHVMRRSAYPYGDEIALRVFGAITPLSHEEQTLVSRLCLYRETVQAGSEFARQGDAMPARLIVSGWACRQRSLLDGRRQILGFLLPGDTVGLASAPSPLDTLSTVAVTRVECVDALILREILSIHDERHAGLQYALDSVRRYQEQCLIDHTVRLGRQSAHERTCHFLLELRQRCRIAGISDGNRFPMPLTQEAISDALGLSVVHLNRTLQQMKRERLIEVKSSVVTILDAERMAVIADFEPYVFEQQPYKIPLRIRSGVC